MGTSYLNAEQPQIHGMVFMIAPPSNPDWGIIEGNESISVKIIIDEL